MPKLIGHFKNKHPEVEILMLVGNSAKLVYELKQHALDLIIISEPLSAKRFIVKPFVDDELVVIVNPHHRWTNNQDINLNDLFKESLIAREEGSGTREVFYNFLNSNNVNIKDLKVVMTMGSSEAVKSAVESGVAYGIVSEIAVRREIKMGLLKKINIEDIKLRRKFLVAYPTKLYNKHLISTFLDFILTKKDEFL